MGRPAALSQADFIAAATRAAARLGPARTSIAAISKEAGVPTGSIYHRMPSRDALLAEIWLTAAEEFQAGVMARGAAAKTLDDLVEVALLTPRFARERHAEAVVLNAHRRDDFLTDAAPEAYRQRAVKLGSELREGLTTLAKRMLPGDARAREKLAVALIGIPLGAVRIFLPQATPPKEIDATIAAAVRAALGSQ